METAASTVENAEASVDIHNAMLTKGQAVTADPSHDDKRSGRFSMSAGSIVSRRHDKVHVCLQ